MGLQNVLSEVFNTWLTGSRGIHEIVLCDSQGLPIVSAGTLAQANELSLSAATVSIHSVSNNVRALFANSSIEYINIKMRGRKVFIWKLPTQDMCIMFFISSPTIAEMRKMVKTLDFIVQVC